MGSGFFGSPSVFDGRRVDESSSLNVGSLGRPQCDGLFGASHHAQSARSALLRTGGSGRPTVVAAGLQPTHEPQVVVLPVRQGPELEHGVGADSHAVLLSFAFFAIDGGNPRTGGGSTLLSRSSRVECGSPRLRRVLRPRGQVREAVRVRHAQRWQPAPPITVSCARAAGFRLGVFPTGVRSGVPRSEPNLVGPEGAGASTDPCQGTHGQLPTLGRPTVGSVAAPFRCDGSRTDFRPDPRTRREFAFPAGSRV
jgi:hypothetical protein